MQAPQVTSARTNTPDHLPSGRCDAPDRRHIHRRPQGPELVRDHVQHQLGDDPRHASIPSGASFDANAAAKTAGTTPLKRPENGQFRPGTDFKEFYFDATGDTNATSTANAEFGGWGGVYKLTQAGPGADTGKLALFYAGNNEHTGLDNTTFIDRDHVSFVEDAGDGLHAQRGAFDSAYLFDARVDYSKGAQPVQFIAGGVISGTPGQHMLGALRTWGRATARSQGSLLRRDDHQRHPRGEEPEGVPDAGACSGPAQHGNNPPEVIQPTMPGRLTGPVVRSKSCPVSHPDGRACAERPATPARRVAPSMIAAHRRQCERQPRVRGRAARSPGRDGGPRRTHASGELTMARAAPAASIMTLTS
jgi:hypothetical protein